MTIEEFDSKTLPTLEDSVQVLKSNPFEPVCAYIRDSMDMKATNLLEGIFNRRGDLSKDQILRLCESALFSDSPAAYMRWSATALAVKLARGAGCGRELNLL